MFQKVHLRLAVLCGSITAFILLAMSLGYLYISEQGLKTSNFSSFRNDMNTLIPPGHAAGAGYACQHVFLRAVDDVAEGELPCQFHFAGTAGDIFIIDNKHRTEKEAPYENPSGRRRRKTENFPCFPVRTGRLYRRYLL